MDNPLWTAKQAWDHLAHEVVNAGNILPHWAYSVGLSDIEDFLYLRQHDFEFAFDLPTLDRDGNPTIIRQCLSRVIIGKLERAQRWYNKQPTRSYSTWSNLTREGLNEFREPDPSPPNITATVPSTPTPFTTMTMGIDTPHSKKSEREKAGLASYTKSIKRSSDDYPAFLDGKLWYSWQRKIRTKATAQGYKNVLSSTYVPFDEESEIVWEEHQSFMFDVLSDKVQTPTGKQIVRKYEDTLDAQRVWQDLCREYASGIQADIAAASIEQELLAMRCDVSWKSVVKFMGTWRLKLLDLEQIRDEMIIPDALKRQWLGAALLPNREMASAVAQAKRAKIMIRTYVDKHIALTSPSGSARSSDADDFSFDDYFDFLLDTAKQMDENSNLATKGARTVNIADTTTIKTDSGTSNSTKPTIEDSKIDFTAEHLPNEVWKKMSSDQKRRYWKSKREREKANDTKTNNGPREANTSEVSSTDDTIIAGNITPNPPGTTLRQMLSNTASRNTNTTGTDEIGEYMIVQNKLFRLSHATSIKYSVKAQDVSRDHSGALIDGGANGGMAGKDMRILETTDATADVTGIAQNEILDLPISTCAAYIPTLTDPIIGIFHQYAALGKGRTIHSALQLRAFGIDVNDVPSRLGGLQRLATPDGHVIPLSINNGLLYLDMRCPTDQELENIPHVLFTSDMPWNPNIFDSPAASNADMIHDLLPDPFKEQDSRVGPTGDLNDRHAEIDHCLLMVRAGQVQRRTPDIEKLRPYFGWTPIERIRQTIENTTQFARATDYFPFRKHFKTRFPAANVRRLNEVVATDTYFSDTPAADDGINGHGGANMAQVFCGRTSQLTAVYPMHVEAEMPGTLEDFIRHHGAPRLLYSDNAKVQVGKTVHDILRLYHIDNFQCEPHHQHQNYAERRIQELKKMTSGIMARTGTPAAYWYLCLEFVTYLLNRLAVASLGWKTPTEVATGQQADISALVNFHWWEPVYFAIPSTARRYPSKTPEQLGRWVGVASHQGDALTYLVLTDESKNVVSRSAVRSAVNAPFRNLRADNLPSAGGEMTSPTPILHSVPDIRDPELCPSEIRLPSFSPEELLTKTFIREATDGRTFRAEIVRQVLELDDSNQKRIKFLVKLGDGEIEEIIEYNILSDLVEKYENASRDDPDRLWAINRITGHQGPLRESDRRYKGSTYNVLVEWEDGSTTYEPLSIVIKDDPITLAKYGLDNDLLDRDGWKRLKRTVQREKLFKRMLKQAKLRHDRNTPIFMFGVQVPRSAEQAYDMDKKNGDKVWTAAMTAEITQLQDYETFIDKGRTPATLEKEYQRIRCHFVFAVKFDGRRKARFVAGGHLTGMLPVDCTYSSVVTIRSLRLALLAAELNGLKTWSGDIGNAYLEAYTKEKVYFVAGREFGELEGHTLIISKALYGLRSSGARFHDRFVDTVREMGFFPCKADPDVWIRDSGTHYEYVCVYVDDLAVMMRNPEKFFDELQGPKWNYKLKGIGPLEYHLGADFLRDPDGTLQMSAKGYIKRMVQNYGKIFDGERLKEQKSPIDKDDHPELDTSPELSTDGIRVYQSLIGALQWAITLGRFDIQVAVMTMGRFRAAPRMGHLERLKRICGYLKRHPEGAIRFRTGIPDHSQVEVQNFDWSHTVYGSPTEELPKDMPIPRGKPMAITTFVDANLMHDLTTGRSVTGILHLVNQTPVEWYSKRQSTVETSTYGSEFVAARLATEQIIDPRYQLRMMGVPIQGPTYMFGDNQSVVTSSTLPQSTLSKRHNALAYHRVREAIAGKIIVFTHIEGKQNPADILTKFLPYATFWPFVRPLLFWRGETDEIEPPTVLMGVTESKGPESGHESNFRRDQGTEVSYGTRRYVKPREPGTNSNDTVGGHVVGGNKMG